MSLEGCPQDMLSVILRVIDIADAISFADASPWCKSMIQKHVRAVHWPISEHRYKRNYLELVPNMADVYFDGIHPGFVPHDGLNVTICLWTSQSAGFSSISYGLLKDECPAWLPYLANICYVGLAKRPYGIQINGPDLNTSPNIRALSMDRMWQPSYNSLAKSLVDLSLSVGIISTEDLATLPSTLKILRVSCAKLIGKPWAPPMWTHRGCNSYRLRTGEDCYLGLMPITVMFANKMPDVSEQNLYLTELHVQKKQMVLPESMTVIHEPRAWQLTISNDRAYESVQSDIYEPYDLCVYWREPFVSAKREKLALDAIKSCMSANNITSIRLGFYKDISAILEPLSVLCPNLTALAFEVQVWPKPFPQFRLTSLDVVVHNKGSDIFTLIVYMPDLPGLLELKLENVLLAGGAASLPRSLRNLTWANQLSMHEAERLPQLLMLRSTEHCGLNVKALGTSLPCSIRQLDIAHKDGRDLDTHRAILRMLLARHDAL